MANKKYKLVPFNEWFPLNEGELKYWIMRQEHMPVVGVRILLTGNLDIPLLEKAFSYIIKNQPLLWRKIHKKYPMQMRVVADDSFKLQIIDMQKSNIDIATEYEKEICTSLFDFPIPLIKAKLYQFSATKNELDIFSPHITFDLYSLVLLKSFLNETYKALQAGSDLPLIETKYIIPITEEKYTTTNEIHSLLISRLQDIYNYENITIPIVGKNIQTIGKTYTLTKDSSQIKEVIAKKYEVTEFVIFMTVMVLTLAKVFNIKSLFFSIVVSGRDQNNQELFGSFEELQYLKTKITDTPIREFIHHLLELRKHTEVNEERDNIVEVSSYVYKNDWFKKLLFPITAFLFHLLGRLKISKLYTKENVYLYLLEIIGFAPRMYKEKFNNLIAKLGWKRKTDILMILNYTPTPDITNFLGCDLEIIDKLKIFETVAIGFSGTMFLYKFPNQTFEYNLVGRNFTAELRERYDCIFNKILDELSKDKNYTVYELLDNIDE